jgi:serine/threonine protein kinase
MMGGISPLHCQSPTCNGNLRVIFPKRRRSRQDQRLQDQREPPTPKTHPKIPNRRKLATPAAKFSDALTLGKKKPLVKDEFAPFPKEKGSLPFQTHQENLKNHAGIMEHDKLELNGEIYEITSRLGTGGMSSVWKGRNSKTNKPVSVKEFFYTRFHDPETGNNYCEKYWNREIAITQLQSHSPENNMHYIGCLKLESFEIPEYYIFLEYIEGELLDSWFNKRYDSIEKLTEKELQMIITDLLMPIARHMYYVHNLPDKGIVHRDLTVQNLMIRKDPYAEKFTPIIIDWGVSKIVSKMYNPAKPYYVSATPEATGIRNRGTPPEVMAGFEPMAATDIYMLGHIMFYLFSGGHYASSAATNEDFVLHPRDFNPNLPSDFNRLVEYMTQYEPADRMESMLKVYDAIKWLYDTTQEKLKPKTVQSQKQYYLYCDYNEAMIPLPEKEILTIGRDEIIDAGKNHSMDGHLYSALIPAQDGKFTFELYIGNGYAYIRDKFSKLGTYLSNLTATNQQIYNNIPIKGLDNACIQLSHENLGKATIEAPFIAPDGNTYRIQFMIILR